MKITTPKIKPNKISSVKSCFARLGSPAPIFRATMALPPVAIIVPNPTIKLITGQTILIADKAFVLTNRDTNMVSTIV